MGNWPTAPPGGNLVIYVNYTVYFRDPADCAAIRAQYGGYGVLQRPAAIRDALGISETAFGWNLDTANRWIVFPYPPRVVDRSVVDGDWLAYLPVRGTYTYPPDPGAPGNPYWWPPLANVYDYDQDWFTVPGHPAVPIWGAGPAINFVWAALFLSAGGAAGAPVLEPMRPRRFIAGPGEMPRGGEGTFADSPEGSDVETAECYSRDASRTPDGLGIAFRQGNADFIRRRLDEFLTPANTTNSWERFYIRVRQYPTGNTLFWRATSNAGAPFIGLGINAAGNLLVYTQNNFSTLFLVATSASVIPLNTWCRLDLYAIFRPRVVGAPGSCQASGATTGNQGYLTVSVNGAAFVSGDGSCHDAFGTTTLTHESSSLGLAPSTNALELDVDDWSNSDPGPCGAPTYQNTLDWGFGSHVQLVRPTAFGAGHAASWTNTFRTALQNPAWRASATGASWNSSGIAGARYVLDTEMDGTLTGVLASTRQRGCLALIAGYVNDPSDAGTDGRVGYTLAGGADVTRIVAETDAINGYSILADIAAGHADMPTRGTYEPVRLLHLHATDITTDNLSAFQAIAQFMGSWGPEDDVNPTTAPGQMPFRTIHNAPYVQTLLGRATPPPLNSVGVASGTYIGNGTGQDISITLPGIHWLYLRNLSTNQITWWWSTMLGAHLYLSQAEILPNNMVRMVMQDDGSTLLQLAGNHAGGNQSGVTYQYVAFSDLLCRVLICGAWKHNSGTPSNLLVDPAFTPEGCWMVLENTENTLTGTGVLYKGAGSSANGGSELWDGELANVATFAAGSITSRAIMHGAAQSQVAYAAFRQDDGTAAFPLYIGQYTGNGAGGTRDIAVSLRGRRPLFAYVQPLNGGGYVRDPSHTATNSTQFTAGAGINTTLGITGGGADMIQVGTGANANGIVHNVFIIPSPLPAASSIGNNGWDAQDVGGLVEPGWATPPSWLLAPPPQPPPPTSADGCVVTFVLGTDTGGGAGCNPTIAGGTDSGGGSGCPTTLQQEEAA